jgi:hypothetical protein
MSSQTPSIRDRALGWTLVAASVLLMIVYGRGQLKHTLRFLTEWLS